MTRPSEEADSPAIQDEPTSNLDTSDHESSYPTALLAGDEVPIAPRLMVLCDGEVQTHAVPQSGRWILGRSKDCDVRIDHRSVSRRHAEMTFDGMTQVRDLGSSNGTFVGGLPLDRGASVAVAHGVTIRFGSVLTVLRPGSTPTGESVPPPASTHGRAAPLPTLGEIRPEQTNMQEVERLIALVAPSDLTVILLGETGVGKSRLAQQLHDQSARGTGKGRFIALNCAALPASMLESELFGHERGAFTGASSDRVGFVEAADGGTLFLDEVGDLPLPMQAKLLHVLENGEVLRLGARRGRRVDVRFVAATNRDLEQMVQSGAFRRDLYFRLNGISIAVPPLRQRPGEILPLAEVFLREGHSGRGQPPELSDEAKRALLRHPFPGNVRELKSLLERAVLLAGEGAELITFAHLRLDAQDEPRIAEPVSSHPAQLQPDPLQAGPLPPVAPPPPSAPLPIVREAIPPPTPSSLRNDVAALEKERILEALAACDGNQTQAAKKLGIARRTLINRMEAYGLPRPRRDRDS